MSTCTGINMTIPTFIQKKTINVFLHCVFVSVYEYNGFLLKAEKMISAGIQCRHMHIEYVIKVPLLSKLFVSLLSAI